MKQKVMRLLICLHRVMHFIPVKTEKMWAEKMYRLKM